MTRQRPASKRQDVPRPKTVARPRAEPPRLLTARELFLDPDCRMWTVSPRGVAEEVDAVGGVLARRPVLSMRISDDGRYVRYELGVAR